MKAISTILLAIFVLIVGCDKAPDLSVNSLEDNFNKALNDITGYELIPLPGKSSLWKDSVFTKSQLIDGSVGGEIIMEKYYISDDGDSIIINANLRIPAGSFKGTETITITLDKNYAAFHFYPAMTFKDTLKLSQSFEGLNLENYQTGTIDFVFIGDNGAIELIKKNGIQVIVPMGIVRVLNAKLMHFSRYGWVRKNDTPGMKFTD